MGNDFEEKIKKALGRISMVSPDFIGAEELLKKKGRQHLKSKALKAALLPLISIFLFLSITAFPVFAGQENLVQFFTSKRVAQELQKWEPLDWENGKLESLSQELGIPLDIVETLKDAGYGNGEIALMVILSKESGKEIPQILEMREKGLGWGRIFSELGVSHEETYKEMERNRKGFQEKLENGSPGNSNQENPLNEPEKQPNQKGKGEGKQSTPEKGQNPTKNSNPGGSGKEKAP